jgi:colicin import membrane protein
MREPSLQRTTLLSFIVHLTVFFLVLVVMRQSNHMVMPSPYTVQLVSSDLMKGLDSQAQTDDTRQETPEAAHPEETQKKQVKEKDLKDKELKDKMTQKKLVEDKIAALAAKDAAKKKVEKRVKLRQVISLKAQGEKKTITGSQASGQGKGAPSEDYYSKITKEIWQQWVFPDIGKKDIEAVIAVRILKDGTALVQRVEKSSGNSLFDKSAIKALAKASPLTPPPYEMEIGVRFYP